jgi:hypothetical protein
LRALRCVVRRLHGAFCATASSQLSSFDTSTCFCLEQERMRAAKAKTAAAASTLAGVGGAAAAAKSPAPRGRAAAATAKPAAQQTAYQRKLALVTSALKAQGASFGMQLSFGSAAADLVVVSASLDDTRTLRLRCDCVRCSCGCLTMRAELRRR